MAITTDTAGAAGDPIPWAYDGAADNGTLTLGPPQEITWGQTYTVPPPDCKEAITILEEAEYELKELLKKTQSTIVVSGKNSQELIVIALRNVQAALRALLKIG